MLHKSCMQPLLPLPCRRAEGTDIRHCVPCECSEMAFPRSLLKRFFPMTLRACTTRGAKGPVAPLLPMLVTSLLGPALPAPHHTAVEGAGVIAVRCAILTAPTAFRAEDAATLSHPACQYVQYRGPGTDAIIWMQRLQQDPAVDNMHIELLRRACDRGSLRRLMAHGTIRNKQRRATTLC